MTKILLVDNNFLMRATVKEIILSNLSQVTVLEAATPKEAVDKVQKEHPHIIFLDINLKDGSGLDLTKKIRSQNPDATIAVLTSSDMPEYREASFKCGADYFLSKASPNGKKIIKLIRSNLLDS